MAIDDISLEPLLNSRFSPIQGYAISDQVTGATSYYGYIDKNGKWHIMKSVVTGAEINYTYVKGDSGYAAAWTGRAGLTYANFATVF